jgi:OmpA-OmpF porin, OOP family
MSLKKIALAAFIGTASVTASSSAVAQAMPDRGWYVGGSFGTTEDNESCPTTSCDLKDSGWKIFGGFRMNRNLAFEGGYADLGSFSAGGTFLGLPANVNVDVTSLNAAVLGIFPLGDRFELFGKAGISFTKYDGSGSVGGFSGSSRDDETELLWGVGATYNINRNFGIRAEWERLNKSEIDMMSLGIQYRF